MRWIAIVCLVFFACKKDAPSKPPVAEWTPEIEQRIDTAKSAMYEVRRAAKELRKQPEGERTWPTGDVPDLDFTKTGNAIIAPIPGDEMAQVLTDKPRFRIVHREDDPFELAQKATGITESDKAKAKYRGAEYRNELERLARAKYALLVLGEYKDAPHTFTGLAVLYEIAGAKLLAGFPLAVESGKDVLDLEKTARDVLFATLKQRFPTVKLPAIAYVEPQMD